VLNAIADRINALAIAHRLLAENEADLFDVSAYLREIGADLLAGSDGIALALDLAPGFVSAAKAPPLALLLHEVIANAVQHAFPGEAAGRIAIEARFEDGVVRIVVADDGVGLPAEPQEGFGLMLVNLLARQLRAEVTREPAHPGTRVSVVLKADGTRG
jgi:two-component sensor histidine kinase